jgi:cysteine synthase A
MQRHIGEVAPSIVEVIGGTPVVELGRLTRGLRGRIVAKLDYLNPGFSKKDRIAREILDDAAASGELRSGQPVVELTSGNTGTGLAIVCAVRGHPFVAVMSQGNSSERPHDASPRRGSSPGPAGPGLAAGAGVR